MSQPVYLVKPGIGSRTARHVANNHAAFTLPCSTNVRILIMSAIFLPNGLQILGWGSAGYVCKVTKDIALKCSTPERTKNEFSVFGLLERHPPCADIVRSFLRLHDLNFMQLLFKGTLEARLQAHQIHDPETGVASATAKEPSHLVLRWLIQLSNAAAWLESLTLAHGDIRPSNLLLDSDDHLKLSDFDNTTLIGESLEAGGAPYARLLGPEAEADCGSFGALGPRTEQFAIGSVYYYLVRGYEPYDNVRFGEDHGCVVVDMLQKMEFPELDESRDDAIIKECWYCGFDSGKDLAFAIRSLNCGEVDGAEPMSMDCFREMQEECKKMISEGLLGFWGYAV